MSQIRGGETERARYWSELVGRWSVSGVSQLEFCRREGIKAGTFAWWKRQLQQRAGAASARRGRRSRTTERFVELRLTSADSQSGSMPGFEVVLPRGRSIRVPAQFDPQVLSRLITTVESC